MGQTCTTTLCGVEIEWELPSAFGGGTKPHHHHQRGGGGSSKALRDHQDHHHQVHKSAYARSVHAPYHHKSSPPHGAGPQYPPHPHPISSSTQPPHNTHPPSEGGGQLKNGQGGGEWRVGVSEGGQGYQPQRRRTEAEVAVPPENSFSTRSEESYKLVLLGSGESGKSTIFKRVMLEYGEGYENSERKGFISSIHENTIETMITLVRESEMSEQEGWQIDEAFQDSVDELLELDESDTLILTKRVASHIQRLWCDEGVREVFEHRSDFQIPDGASYFLEDVHRLARLGYLPSDSDILRCRDRTTGVNSETFALGKGRKTKIELFDLGGQRCERRHWKNAFQNVSAIIFVVALSEFDLSLFEDGDVNRLEESLTVFEVMTGNKKLRNVPFVLFFNKMDLLIEKIESGVEFSFGDYDGPQNPPSVRRFIKNLFEEKCGSEIRPQYIFGSAIDEDEFSPEQLILTAIDM